MATLFFSYSHRDEALRDELETHFALMKRQGLITGWHDRRIGAGNEFAGKISENLERADIILLLVSPYFLDSDYCYDVEMQRALERHEQGQARVMPVILNPCDWRSAPFGKLLALPKDGKPITKYPNQHDALLEVVEAVRAAAASNEKPADRPPFVQRAAPSTGVTAAKTRSSNLRVVKTFTDPAMDAFLVESYEFIANYFEGSLTELQSRNPEIETRFRRIDANHFTATIYRGGAVASQCKIWFAARGAFSAGVFYSGDFSHNDNSYNESMSVDDDGHALFLKPIGMASIGRHKDGRLSQEGAAEYFWEMLVEPLRRRE
ncbi:MAG TPA: toll/interleukin-1 receptor domain-containing protein [Pirellulales bacterium]